MTPLNYKLIIAGVGIFVVAFLTGKYSGPAKIETKIQDHIVYRDHVIQDVAKDVVTTKTETRRPDGTIVMQTIKTDKSKIDTDRVSTGTEDRVTDTRTENRPDWRVGIGYKPRMPWQGPGYVFIVERRVFGELSLGAMAATDRSLGVVVSLGF